MLVSLLALAACPALGVRPDASLLSMSAQGATLGLLKSSDPRQAIDDVKGIMEGVLLDVGNATEHISDDNKATLNTVIDLIENSIYKSMNSSHDADKAALDSAVAAAGECNSIFAGRIAPGGDIGQMQASVGVLQDELNELQSEVDSNTTAEQAELTKLNNHMVALSEAPPCSALPVRNKGNLHSYFEHSAFATWYVEEQAKWKAIEDAYDASAEALRLADEAYSVGLAERNLGYCMWKAELLSSCSSFGQCYEEKKSNYLDVVKPAVEANMNTRIEAFKAGETIVAQIRFLLAASADSTIPDVDATRYGLDFPTLPSQGSCNLEVLDDPSFVPSVVCPSTAGPGKSD